MQALESQLRRWGRSIGVVIPKEAIMKEHLKAGDKVKLIVFRRSGAIKETFGKLKFKKTTDEILRDIDEESWDE